MATPTISRADAIARGLKKYFTGKPCKHGHVADSFVSNCACVECGKIRREQWRVENLDKNRDILRRFREAHPGYDADHRNANRETYNSTARKWYASDPGRAAKIVKKYRERHPETIRTKVRNERARKKAAGAHTAAEIQQLLVKQKFICAGFDCSKSVKEKRHVDHIVPLALGGSNKIFNLQILCPPCNRKKTAKDPIKWANENGRLL